MWATARVQKSTALDSFGIANPFVVGRSSMPGLLGLGRRGTVDDIT